MRSLPLLWSAVFLLSSCAASSETHLHYLTNKGLDTQLPEHFQHCHGYGCKFKTPVEFNQYDWGPIENIFYPRPKSAEAERDAIKQAIAVFETRVGQMAGTSNDRAGTFKKIGDKQLDCVDESTNTTIYLSLLLQKGLLRFHQIEGPSMKLPLIDSGRWPHQTAVISELETSKFFAVDSWFHDNGRPPEIIPLQKWKEGWKPKRIETKNTMPKK